MGRGRLLPNFLAYWARASTYYRASYRTRSWSDPRTYNNYDNWRSIGIAPDRPCPDSGTRTILIHTSYKMKKNEKKKKKLPRNCETLIPKLTTHGARGGGGFVPVLGFFSCGRVRSTVQYCFSSTVATTAYPPTLCDFTAHSFHRRPFIFETSFVRVNRIPIQFLDKPEHCSFVGNSRSPNDPATDICRFRSYSRTF